jgi:hypothetical protein
VRDTDHERAEKRAAIGRWARVNARQDEERKSQDLAAKLDEVERLLLSIDDFGWRVALDDDAPIRARWQELRRRLGGGSERVP